MIALHPGVGLADHDSLAGHAELVPDAVGANLRDVPLRSGGFGLVAGADRRLGWQRAQMRAIQDAVDFGQRCYLSARQRSRVDFDGIQQVVWHITGM